MFILSATLMAFVSCRNDADDPAENISNTGIELVRKAAAEKNNSVLKDSIEMLKDSTSYHLEGGTRPPVKDGGHWKP